MNKLKLSQEEQKHLLLIDKKFNRDKLIAVTDAASPEELERAATPIKVVLHKVGPPTRPR
ncbi:hypothetical protein D3C81_1688150 [compost metagenome]